ncbi:MAG: hypothetical protein QM734_08640 [Cyclobacteriaceae bacterium]
MILFFKYRFINTLALVFLLVTTLLGQDLQEVKIANEYLARGEKEKALEAYQNLAKNQANISTIHSNYFNLLLGLGKYKQAEDYIERQIKRDTKFSYRVDLFIVYVKAGDQAKADRYFKALLKANTEDIYRLKSTADYLSSFNLLNYAGDALLQTRVAGGPMLFSLELANLYRMQGRREEMVNEYLNYVTLTPGNGAYVKNLLQMLLSKPEELETLERVLFERVQQNQDSEIFADLLIWVNLQQKIFITPLFKPELLINVLKKMNRRHWKLGRSL